MITRRRGLVNVILPGKLFQRAQILSWERHTKINMFRSIGVRAVVNLWPKLDPDLSDAPLDWYLHLPCHRSEEALRPAVAKAAEDCASYLTEVPEASLLVLCEAGKTRSAFFCVLVLRKFLSISCQEAYNMVSDAVPSVELKGFMLVRMKELDGQCHGT